MLPRILKNFNVIVNGRGLAGRAESCSLPEISLKTEGHRAGGMDTESDVDMGMEPLSAKWSMKDPDLEVLGLAGLADSNSARLTFRGSFVRDTDQNRVAVIAEAVGRVKKSSPGDWKAGDAASNDFEMSINYYRLTVGGVEVYEIDVENMIRRIRGVDQLAGIRADIGI